MKVMKDENLVKEQMKVISELQDKIKLLKFDNSENSRKIKELKEKLKRRNENIKNIRLELSCMKRKDDFSNINSVLAMINDNWSENYED